MSIKVGLIYMEAPIVCIYVNNQKMSLVVQHVIQMG